jgi:hypothetical protein
LGACYIFNSGRNATNNNVVPLKESLRAGPTYGLRLSVYTSFYDRLITPYNAYYGLIVRIGNSSYASLDYGHELEPGRKTNIMVERFFEKQLTKPYSNCDIDNNDPSLFRSDSELYNLIWHSPIDYTQQLCFEVCYMKTIERACGCITSDKYSFFPSNVTICIKDSACLKNMQSKFQSNVFFQANCLK